jgi:hypothetical protein
VTFGKTIAVKKRQNFKRILLTFTFVFSLTILTISLFSGTNRALIQCATAGAVGNADTIYHSINDVQMNNIIVVGVNPVEFNCDPYYSVVFYTKRKENKLETSHMKNGQKMPVFHCTCGAEILIVPDLAAMKKAIKNHLNQHNKVVNQCLTEENLTREILTAISLFVSKF